MSAPAKPLLIYGVNGDGRGHAARALVLAPYLRPHFRLVFHSSQDALALLRQSFVNQPDITFVEIPGTGWIYRNQRISSWRSTLHFLAQAFHVFPREARRLAHAWRDSSPVGVICDFEPVVARAAALAGLPLVALSHQHAMAVMDPAQLGLLPFQQWIYRLYAWLNTPRFGALAISSFFQLPLRAGASEALIVGGLLRPGILQLSQAHPQAGGAPLAYLRRHCLQLPVLRGLDQLVPGTVVFGLDDSHERLFPCLRFCPVDPIGFVSCLAAAPFLVAAAGHQLLCEALELRKPVLALYECAHDEQRLNARMWERAGYGMAVELESFQPQRLQDFLDALSCYRRALQDRVGARQNAPLTARWMLRKLALLA
jgi:UDP:flavonoid glycosyltransferase YjiC (YdhE family)